MQESKKTPKNVQAALEAVDDYLARRAPTLFRPILDHLHEVGEARSSTELEAHFKRNFNIEGVTTACEYLADQANRQSLNIRSTNEDEQRPATGTGFL